MEHLHAPLCMAQSLHNNKKVTLKKRSLAPTPSPDLETTPQLKPQTIRKSPGRSLQAAAAAQPCLAVGSPPSLAAYSSPGLPATGRAASVRQGPRLSVRLCLWSGPSQQLSPLQHSVNDLVDRSFLVPRASHDELVVGGDIAAEDGGSFLGLQRGGYEPQPHSQPPQPKGALEGISLGRGQFRASGALGAPPLPLCSCSAHLEDAGAVGGAPGVEQVVLPCAHEPLPCRRDTGGTGAERHQTAPGWVPTAEPKEGTRWQCLSPLKERPPVLEDTNCVCVYGGRRNNTTDPHPSLAALGPPEEPGAGTYRRRRT